MGIKVEKPATRSRKTQTIVLGVAMSSLILTSCAEDGVNPRRCVDQKTSKVVESYRCEDDETTRRYGGTAGGGHFWYWGGSGYRWGETVSGGSTTTPRGYSAPGYFAGSKSGHVSSSSRGFLSSITRGGFGGMASAHGGGGA